MNTDAARFFLLMGPAAAATTITSSNAPDWRFKPLTRCTEDGHDFCWTDLLTSLNANHGYSAKPTWDTIISTPLVAPQTFKPAT